MYDGMSLAWGLVATDGPRRSTHISNLDCSLTPGRLAAMSAFSEESSHSSDMPGDSADGATQYLLALLNLALTRARSIPDIFERV